MSKFLIAGLGNIGDDYVLTRHNIGFEVADAFVKAISGSDSVPARPFENGRLAMVHHGKFKGKQVVVIKPTTYMNLSGKAVNYWLQTEKIPLENLLVVTDDLALPFGTLRMKKKGSDGGHNGLSDIAATLNTTEYCRLRFGIGSDFTKGQQVNYVLGKWSEEEKKGMEERIQTAVEMIKSFMSIGIERTMSQFNKK